MSGKQYVILVGCLVAVAVLLNLPIPAALQVKAAMRDNLTPFSSVVTYVERHARGVWWYLSAAWQAPESEQSLRAENAELQREIWRLRELGEENRQLREMAAFRQQRPERLLIAEVVSRGDTVGWWHSVRLNRGTAEGVRLDLPVLTARGLVGRTAAVSQHTCDVLLMTDPAVQISCRVGQDNAFGILRGLGVSMSGDPRLAMLFAAPPAEIEYLSAEKAVREGDSVVTSGLGGVYPGGILVGRVESVRLDSSQLFMKATVTPAADLASLHYVFIMLKDEPPS